MRSGGNGPDRGLDAVGVGLETGHLEPEPGETRAAGSDSDPGLVEVTFLSEALLFRAFWIGFSRMEGNDPAPVSV